MPNKKSRKHRVLKSFGDITLNDSASSTVCKNRIKNSKGGVSKVLKQFQEEEKTWDEEIDSYEEQEFVEVTDEEGNITYELRKTEPRRRRKTVSSSEDAAKQTGKDYPIDIWFLLSEYIRPEDVGRFAAICKTSFEVVCTAKFWYSLYRRHYHSTSNLPEEFQPECLVRNYGLKASVVRSLYYMYPPFIDSLKDSRLNLEGHPDVMCKRLCESLWHKRYKEYCVFYFKMREKRDNLLKHSCTADKIQPDLLDMLDDISANVDENCKVLQVICKHFVPVPPVIGQVLTSVSVTLSSCLRYNKLQLDFGSGISAYRHKDCSDCTSIILDSVVSYKVLDWWHPLYPRSHQLEGLLNRDY